MNHQTQLSENCGELAEASNYNFPELSIESGLEWVSQQNKLDALTDTDRESLSV